jgi:hypothetical protein
MILRILEAEHRWAVPSKWIYRWLILSHSVSLGALRPQVRIDKTKSS